MRRVHSSTEMSMVSLSLQTISKKQSKETDGVHSLKLSVATSTAKRNYSTRNWRRRNAVTDVTFVGDDHSRATIFRHYLCIGKADSTTFIAAINLTGIPTTLTPLGVLNTGCTRCWDCHKRGTVTEHPGAFLIPSLHCRCLRGTSSKLKIEHFKIFFHIYKRCFSSLIDIIENYLQKHVYKVIWK